MMINPLRLNGHASSKRHTRIVWQKYYFALSSKSLFLIIGAFGLATMWEAFIADVGVTVIARPNAMRVLKKISIN